MASSETSNTTPAPQMRPEEMRGLATRLRARAQSLLLRHQPEQHQDLVTAAGLIEQFASVSTEIRSAAALADGLARGLTRLRDSMGGA
jgi:hypothetical protein